MSKLTDIIKSRLIKPDGLPEWYGERLSICNTCPNFSGNRKPTNLEERAWKMAGMGENVCFTCGCPVVHKAKLATEQCPNSLWLAQKPEDSYELDIITDSRKINFGWDKNTKKFIVDYGEILYNTNSDFKLTILNKGITELYTQPACGCTTVSHNVTQNGIEVELKYDTLRVGNFNKSVVLNYVIQGKTKQTILIIKGNVKK